MLADHCGHDVVVGVCQALADVAVAVVASKAVVQVPGGLAGSVGCGQQRLAPQHFHCVRLLGQYNIGIHSSKSLHLCECSAFVVGAPGDSRGTHSQL